MADNISDRRRRNIFVRISYVLTGLPETYKSRFTHSGVVAVKPYRDIYYSTVFAFASAALAFMTQFMGKHYQGMWMISLSLLCFGISLTIVILIHFLHVIHVTSWDYFQVNAKGKKAGEQINEDTPLNVMKALDDSFTLMVASAYLDLFLLLSLLVALISFCSFVFINL